MDYSANKIEKKNMPYFHFDCVLVVVNSNGIDFSNSIVETIKSTIIVIITQLVLSALE